MLPKKQNLSENQSKAADPSANVWVQANAGTGKTSVLVQRLLRILFRSNDFVGAGSARPDNRRARRLRPTWGGPPQPLRNIGILCLTYTNAGASEMRNRILGRLREWAYADDDALRDLLVGVAHNNPPANVDLAAARAIFYEYIDNPQMLKIRTIHGFCEEILRRFPLEAGVPPAWKLISGSDQKQLQKDAFAELLNKTDDVNLSNAFSRILEQTSEYKLDDLLDILTGLNRDYFSDKNNLNFKQQFIDTTKKILNMKAMAHDEFYSPENMALRRQILNFISDEEKPAAYMQKISEYIKKYFPDNGSRLTDKEFSEYKDLFLTSAGTKRQAIAKKEYLTGEQDLVFALNNAIANNAIYENTLAMHDVALAFADKYWELKAARGVLDFDDLISKTAALFEDPAQMGWVLSQLDVNLNHILVDEAQDTSPNQWRIINALAADLEVDGDTASAGHSVFVVGDTKQSIYSFQGAAPDAFMESKKTIGDSIKICAREIINIPLAESFRSTAPILSAVDCFFSDPEIARIANFANNTHKCTRTGDAGLVELHPVVITNRDAGEKASDTRREYIKGIADKITGLISTGSGSANGSIAPSDIMILVQRRSGFAAPLISELQKRGVPVAGSDRIILPEFPAIRDLLNVARFCIDPANDYALACVLKSPLFRLGEAELYKLCHNREKQDLFSRINELNVKVYEELQSILGCSKLPPYSFFMRVLNTDGRREKMIAALGAQIIDPLEEFLTICLSYERTQPGGLADFMEWFINGGAEIKRETNADSGVRIMTVHGSKGLDSKIVFLIDTVRPQKKEGKRPVSIDPSSQRNAGINCGGGAFLWRGDAPESVEFAAALGTDEQKQLEEYYRLLYVAMTRARDWLYIYGYHNHKNPNENSWHARLSAILPNHTDAITDNEGITRISNF